MLITRLAATLTLVVGPLRTDSDFAFAVALEQAGRREPVRLYHTKEELSPVLRGRLLIAKQLRSSLTNPHLLSCEIDRLDSDNPINRLLHWATDQLLGVVSDGKVRTYLSHRKSKLPEVSTTRSPFPFRTALPRQFSDYETALELTLALARAEGPHPESAAAHGGGFVVGTERMFERFVEQSLAAVSLTSAWTVLPQYSEVFAQPKQGNFGREYFSKPDNVIKSGSATVLVIDAKYKRFEDATEEHVGSRPTNADLYQVAAQLSHTTVTVL